MNNKEISIIKSLFNPDISNGLLNGIYNYLECNNLKSFKDQIKIYEVPGAFEIPGAANQLIKKNNSSCIICLGSVVKGETAHFEYISKGVTDGIMQLTLESDIPVIFGVLTVYDYQQALSRASIDHRNKGAELIEAAILSIKTYNKINS